MPVDNVHNPAAFSVFDKSGFRLLMVFTSNRLKNSLPE